MKFSLENTVGLSSSIQRDLLLNRGVDVQDIDIFLDKTIVGMEYQEDKYGLSNILKAAKVTDGILRKQDRKIMIIVDSDVDGYTSATIIWKYIHRVYGIAEIDYFIHANKEVGLPEGDELKEMEKYDIIIIPDAGSSDFEKHEQLSKAGVQIIVLDHHETERESKYAIVVNNQISKNYKNKFLSGAGVAYKFCQVLDDLTGSSYSSELVDLAGLGIAADNMDMRIRDNIVIVREGVNLMNAVRGGNLFIKALINQKSFSLGEEVYPIDLMFYIAPLINAVIRMGTMEEKQMMFDAFIKDGSKVIGQGRNNKGQLVFIEKEMSRMAVNIKNKQGREEIQGMEKLSQMVEDRMMNDKVLILEATNIVNRSMTGLVANKIQSKYNKPTLILMENDEEKKNRKEGDIVYLYGSGRCPSGTELDDFRMYLNNTGLVEYAQGHAAAFGIKIKKENLKELVKLSNILLKKYNFKKIHEIDFLMDSSQIDEKYIYKLDEMKHLWGTRLDEARIMVTGMKVDKNNINFLGKKEDTLMIRFKGVEYIMFRAGELISSIPKSNSFEVTIIGKPNINEWGGKTIPQVIVDECTIKASSSFIF